MLHAVFATTPEHQRSRVTGWLGWERAQQEWDRLNDRRVAGELPHLKFLEVRSVDDPKYNALPHQPWDALPVGERLPYVKLTRSERERLIKIGRQAGNFHDAADAIMTELLHDPQWDHLEAITVSDYAWAAAHFCFPHEAATW